MREEHNRYVQELHNLLTQHFDSEELRLMLAQRGQTPGRTVRFLDSAVEHAFLQRVGGNYIFIHRLLLEYFARVEGEAAL